MRVVMVRISCLVVGLLFLCWPAFALNYSGSVWLDWSTLQFSGASLATNGELEQGHGIVLSSSLPQTDPGLTYAFHTGFHLHPWQDHRLMETLGPTVPLGIADSHAAGDRLAASVTMIGPGLLQSDIWRSGEIVATGGTVTMQVGYGLSELAAVPGVQSGVTFETWLGPHSSRQVLPFTNSSGVLSISRVFEAGERALFGAYTEIHAASSSVPLPAMLWPTAAGFVALAIYRSRSKYQASNG